MSEEGLVIKTDSNVLRGIGLVILGAVVGFAVNYIRMYTAVHDHTSIFIIAQMKNDFTTFAAAGAVVGLLLSAVIANKKAVEKQDGGEADHNGH